MIQYGMSPIEEALYDYRERMRDRMSQVALRCTSCDRLKTGVSFPLTGEFLCEECMMNRMAKQLDNDPEYIRKERVYKMHKAIEMYKCRSKT